MSDLVPTGGAGDLASGARQAGGVIADGVRYGSLLAQLGAASLALRGVSERVRGTYRYVERCAEQVDGLADKAAAMNVDGDTVAEHRDAAAIMRSVLADAEAMAEATEDLSTSFEATAAAHQADYGSVAEAAAAMPVPMADRQFYSNR